MNRHRGDRLVDVRTASLEAEIRRLQRENSHLVRAIMAGWSWAQYVFAEREGIEPPIPKDRA